MGAENPRIVRELLLQIIAAEEEELDNLLMAMGRLCALIIGDMEDDEEMIDDASWVVVYVDVDAWRRMGDPAFKLHFRMSKTVFEALVQQVVNHMVDTNRLMRLRTPIDLILLMVIWILATNDTFRSVALKFMVRPGVVHYHYLRIIAVLREMGPQFIQWPDAAERIEIKTYFEEATGYPGVVGCLDGTHCYIIAPKYQRARYLNRHHSYRMNTQAVCDHRLLIRDLHVGECGSLHDSRVFRRSPLYRNLLSNEYTAVDEHILGDGAYLLRNMVMTPYRNNGFLTFMQRLYNRVQAACRSRIENCFGRLFQMWRRMKFLHVMHIEYAVDHIVACCVLHNFIILNGDPVEEFDVNEVDADEDADDIVADDEEDEDDDDNDDELLAQAKICGIEKRLHITNLLRPFNADQ